MKLEAIKMDKEIYKILEESNGGDVQGVKVSDFFNVVEGVGKDTMNVHVNQMIKNDVLVAVHDGGGLSGGIVNVNATVKRR